jgi:hypothetical protein
VTLTLTVGRSVPRCCKQDKCRDQLVVREPPARKDMNTETENIVGSRYHTTSEHTAD